VPFLRVTRDQRGYETTFLLHAGYPGSRPRVLYWYRSAPGLRVGRTPLDEDAIRAIEERYPDLDFDWPSLIEQSTALPPEIERRPERPRRRPPRPPADQSRPAAGTAEPDASGDEGEDERPAPPRVPVAADATSPAAVPAARPRSILDELVGREIAGRLRARYAELTARLASADPARRDEWQSRAAILDPDSWQTPEEILHGVEHADERFDQLKAEMES
jgi:hypothetical protein